MSNDTSLIEALKDAYETLEWADENMNCPDHLVETWGNSYMQALSLIEQELNKRGVKTRPDPDPADLPF